MSRIGKLPISLPKGVELTVNSNNLVTVKGPKGTLVQQIDTTAISVTIEDNTATISRATEQKRHKSLWIIQTTYQQYGSWCFRRV